MRNHSYENDFDLHENETACRTHFHKKGFALRLALKRHQVQENSEMAYWPKIYEEVCIYTKNLSVSLVHLLYSAHILPEALDKIICSYTLNKFSINRS